MTASRECESAATSIVADQLKPAHVILPVSVRASARAGRGTRSDAPGVEHSSLIFRLKPEGTTMWCSVASAPRRKDAARDGVVELFACGGASLAPLHDMENRAVIRAKTLRGRAVVDLDHAEKVGRIDRIVLDPDARQVAAFLVSRGTSLTGDSVHMTVPASAVHAIGPDALTIHRGHTTDAAVMDRIESLPKTSDLIGRTVVSEGGRFLGKIDDVLIRRDDGHIVGYTLGAADLLKKLEALVRGGRKTPAPYLRADAELRTGKDLIVAPEGSVSDANASGESQEPEIVLDFSHESGRRGIEPGAPLAPGTTIRRAD
jgi:uncharacterized protein YrrD